MKKEIHHTFNREFCKKLEYHLCAMLTTSENPNVKRFWCDGVLSVPFVCEEDNVKYLSIEAVSKRKYIETTARLGVSGQDSYNMKIILGMNAQEAYNNRRSMINCISNKRLSKWFEINVEKREVVVKLK